MSGGDSDRDGDVDVDGLTPFERIGGSVHLFTTKGTQQPIGNELDVLSHKIGVHANQINCNRQWNGSMTLMSLKGMRMDSYQAMNP